MVLISPLLRAAGRAGIAGMFIVGGLDSVRQPASKAPTAAKIGTPQPELAVRLNGAAMVAAGSLLALGIRPRLSALVLAGCLVPTTLAGHPFWEIEEPDQRRPQQIHFLKNVSMLGGLLYIIATDPSGRHRRDEDDA